MLSSLLFSAAFLTSSQNYNTFHTYGLAISKLLINVCHMLDLHWSVCGASTLCCVGSPSHNLMLDYIVSVASPVRLPSLLASGGVVCPASPVSQTSQTLAIRPHTLFLTKSS